MKNNFQSKSVPRGTRTIWRYLSALFLLFTFAIGNVWAADPTYDNPSRSTYAEKTFLNVAGTQANVTGTDNYLCYGTLYMANTVTGDKFFARLSGTGGTSSSAYTYATPATGFLAANSTSATNTYGSINANSDRPWGLYFTGATQVSVLKKDNNTSSNKWVTLKLYTVAADGTETLVETKEESSPDKNNIKVLSCATTLSASAYYKLEITSGNTSNCPIYQVSFKQPDACSTEITTQPSGATIAVGDANPELSIVATNVASYAWKESSDGTSYDGASSLGSSASFTPSVNDAVQTKYYYCEVTSSCDGAAVSKSDIVTVNVVGAISYYTVTLNPAGGTIVDATGWTLNAGNYEKEVAEGTVLTLPTFTKTDRAFKTWRKAGPADVASPVTVDGDLSLTAIWTATIESVIYSWEGAEGGATETGGTATGSVDGLINVAKSGYYCLQINGNTSYDKYVQITLSGEEKVKTGDKIRYTGFYTNTETKNAAVKMRASGGTAIFTGANLPRIEEASPRTDTYVVPEGINTASVQITRHQTQTSSFLTKLQIVREVQVEEGDLLTVTFNSNGGSEVAAVAVASGQAVAKPADPTKAHNRFNEWQLSGSTYNFSTPVTANITLVANWTPLYTVTYAANGGSGEMADANEYAAGDAVTLKANEFGAPDVNHVWDSWAVTDASSNPVSVSEGKFAMPNSAATVTAQWALISDFDVKFFQGYGDPDAQIGETQSISTGNYAAAPTPDPTREGYNFKGWSYDATEEHIVNVAEYAITAVTNFTAIWKQVFIVTFDGAGSVNVESGSKVASPDSPTQTGKVFQGWYNGESKYDFSAAVTGNLALESKWADANPNHFYYTYNDDFHFDGVVYKTPDGKTKDPEAAEASNVALETNPYTLFSGTAGITSIIATNGIYDYKKAAGTKHITAYLKLKADDATSNVVFTIASGYTAVLKLKMNGYSSNATISLKKGDDAVTPSGTQEGTAEGKNYGELTYNLTSGEYKLTTANKTLYISHIDLEATAIPAKVVIYKAGEGTGDDVVDDNATEVLDCPNSFTAPEGKIFHGWKDALDNDVAVGTIVEADMELTAQWIAHYAVTFDMQGHGTQIVAQDIVHGSKAVKPADPIAIGWDFGGWYKESACTNAWDFDNDVVTEATELFAKWTADPCPDKKSIVKVVMTAYNDATVTGYNANEYAGGKIINNLNNSSDNKNTYDFGEGDVTGYKLAGSKSAIMATLAKGDFEYGDKIVVAVTKPASSQKLRIYAASDVDNVLLVKEFDAATAGIYEYKFTVAEIEAINDAGYKSIGVFRGDYNPYVYSVELKGCRSWSVYHVIEFRKSDESVIASENLEEGAYASTVAPAAPKVHGYRFLGWSTTKNDATAIVDIDLYTITADAVLYAIYEEIDCTGIGTKFKFQMKDDLTSGNVFAQAPNSIQATTTNYLSELTGGEVEFSVSGTNNNRILFYDQKAVGFANGPGGQITIALGCPLKENDEIRFINYASSGNSMTLSDGTNSTTLNGNNAETVQTFVVPAAWETTGSYELTLVRGNNTPKLTYFEIYRPAKFDVSFNMMGHGTQIADIEDVIEGSKITAPTAPTDANYSFAGWYKENTLANEWDFDNDVVVANTTLFAKWLDKSDATLKSLKYGDTEIALEAGVYTYNVSLPAFTSAVPALTAETSNPNATKVIANADAFDSEGNATSTVTVTPEVGADQVYKVNFAKGVEILLQDVTGSITWNFANAVTGTVNITGTPQVLANYGGVTNDNTFESDKLEASGEKFTAGSKANLRANYIHFRTTVPGILSISYSNTGGSNPARYIYVNGAKYDEEGSANTTPKGADSKVFVPAGDVELVMKDGEDVSKNVQIYQMIFNATPDYTRDVTEGKYGTICLPTNGVMIGTTIYTLAFYGATSQKIFFDEVVTGRMEAGKPYLFLPEQGVTELKVFYTDAVGATPDPEGVNGFIGFIGANAEASTQVPDDGDHYIIHNNTYRQVLSGAEAYIKSNRAYIKFSAIDPKEPAKAPGARRIGLGKDEAQGFENLQSGDQPMKVMIDGTLYIIRGEKVYNANGQVVK